MGELKGRDPELELTLSLFPSFVGLPSRCQDQTVKVAEATVLESELTRLREENLDLKRQVGEIAGVEEKRKKAEAKVETLEEKVRLQSRTFHFDLSCARTSALGRHLSVLAVGGGGRSRTEAEGGDRRELELTFLPFPSRSLQMDELIQERVTSKENELNATYDERMRNYEDRSVQARLSLLPFPKHQADPLLSFFSSPNKQ